jgi:hypothetical protein
MMSTGVVTCIDRPPEEPDDFNLKKMIEQLWIEAERKYGKKRRAEKLKEIRVCDLVEKALEHELKAYEQNIDTKKDTRAGEVGTNITEMYTQFSKFLESYSGIADIVKGVNHLGGVAYGGLSTPNCKLPLLNFIPGVQWMAWVTSSRAPEISKREKNASEAI